MSCNFLIILQRKRTKRENWRKQRKKKRQKNKTGKKDWSPVCFGHLFRGVLLSACSTGEGVGVLVHSCRSHSVKPANGNSDHQDDEDDDNDSGSFSGILFSLWGLQMHCLKPVNKRVHYNKFVKTKFVEKNLSVKQVYCVGRRGYRICWYQSLTGYHSNGLALQAFETY